jgi:hypothetical protein
MTRHDANMTRRDRDRPSFSFTPIAVRGQPSIWSRGALYGAGLLMIVAVLSLGYTTVRPTPRRRSPAVPSPAWARRRNFWK